MSKNRCRARELCTSRQAGPSFVVFDNHAFCAAGFFAAGFSAAAFFAAGFSAAAFSAAAFSPRMIGCKVLCRRPVELHSRRHLVESPHLFSPPPPPTLALAPDPPRSTYTYSRSLSLSHTHACTLIHTDALTHAHTTKEHAWCLPGAPTHAAMQVQPCSAPFELNIGLNQYRSMH